MATKPQSTWSPLQSSAVTLYFAARDSKACHGNAQLTQVTAKGFSPDAVL